MRLLVIDNHDSFVYNIIGLLEKIRKDGMFPGLEWEVVANDVIDPATAGSYAAMILSPGPGIPREAGNLMELLDIRRVGFPVFGVCLGFQAIAEHYGASLVNMPCPLHGHMSYLKNVDRADPVVGMLAGSEACVGRYHSWVVEPSSLPSSLMATSYDEEGNIMSLRHKSQPVFGTQFHPESIITNCGRKIMEAFIRIVYGGCRNSV